MNSNASVIKAIEIPKNYKKKTTIAKNIYYDKLEIFGNRVVGYSDGEQKMTWFFKDYTGIDFVKANLNSQFSQIVFLTGVNSKNRVTGIDIGSAQNANAMNDTNRILFCSGMFSFKKTNDFSEKISSEIKSIFEEYRNNSDTQETTSGISTADEIKKFKALLDDGVITQEEFELKKKQMLGV